MLVGIVDPSHKEKASDTLGRLPAWLTLDEALAAADDGKWSPYPFELMAALLGEHQERLDHISTSALVSHCPRAEVIARKAEWVGDLSDMWAALRGTFVHRTLEQYAHTDSIAEARFHTSLDGIDFSCSPDLLTRTTLSDYKVTDYPPMYNSPWQNHTEQVMVNAYIVRNYTAVEPTDGIQRLPFEPREEVASKVQLVYLGPKGPKVLVVERKAADYVDLVTGKNVKGAKEPYVWDDDEAEKFIRPRLAAFKAALDSYPKFPDGVEELWGGSKSWACPGRPLCRFDTCLARRYPERLVW